jgi:hypothetical protein
MIHTGLSHVSYVVGQTFARVGNSFFICCIINALTRTLSSGKISIVIIVFKAPTIFSGCFFMLIFKQTSSIYKRLSGNNRVGAFSWQYYACSAHKSEQTAGNRPAYFNYRASTFGQALFHTRKDVTPWRTRRSVRITYHYGNLGFGIKSAATVTSTMSCIRNIERSAHVEYLTFPARAYI